MHSSGRTRKEFGNYLSTKRVKEFLEAIKILYDDKSFKKKFDCYRNDYNLTFDEINDLTIDECPAKALEKYPRQFDSKSFSYFGGL